jgi:hypothetical protein
MKKVLAMCAFALFTLAANAQAPASKKEAKMDKGAPAQTAPTTAPAPTVTPAAGTEAAPKVEHKMNKRKRKSKNKIAAPAETK